MHKRRDSNGSDEFRLHSPPLLPALHTSPLTALFAVRKELRAASPTTTRQQMYARSKSLLAERGIPMPAKVHDTSDSSDRDNNSFTCARPDRSLRNSFVTWTQKKPTHHQFA